MSTSTKQGEPIVVSDNERLISALQSCFHVMIKNQEEQTDKIQKVIEALKPHASADEKTAFWNSYMKLADEQDKEFQEKYSNDLDASLIFAGLFSAVSSAFIIQIQPQLTADPRFLVIVGQSLLYISLFTTLLATLLAVLGKQWVMYYDAAGSRGSIEERGLERQRKLDGLRRWKFDAVLQTFPLLLQLALFLFSTGLSIYLWTVHHAIAIIVMALASSGFAAYFFLLASSIISPDSPFQNPLASFLYQILSRTWSTVSLLFKSARQILPCFTSNALIPPPFQLGSQSEAFYYDSDFPSPSSELPPPPFQLGPQSEASYYDSDFASPSSELPAVLWVLETSTDPELIEVAAGMVIRLQWARGLNFYPPMARLIQTFDSCFEINSGGGWRLRPGMMDRAINCGRAYCSLRLIARIDQHFDYAVPSPGDFVCTETHDPRVLQLRDVWQTARGVQEALVGPWDDPVAVQWALHVAPSSREWSFEIERRVDGFLDQFPANNLPSLDHSSFANYLCCINSFLFPVDARILAQLDKSPFREALIARLFDLLNATTINNDLIAKIIRTTAQLAHKSVEQKYIAKSRRSVLALFAATSRFCAAFPRVHGWLDVFVSAAKLTRLDDLGNWESTFKTYPNLPAANPQNVGWIYSALEQAQQLWEDYNGDSQWDDETAVAVDSLLQMLVFHTPLPDKLPLKAFHVVLRALSVARASSPAFLVLHHSRNWFLDPDFQQMIHNLSVWPQVARIATSLPELYGWRYIDMVEKIAHASEWKALLYKELDAWITVFPDKLWQFEKFVTVIRNVWVPDFPVDQYIWADHQIWALTMTALTNVWGDIDVADLSALHRTLRLARCTIQTAFRGLDVDIRATFCPPLEKSLTRAAANARKLLAEPPESNVPFNKQGLEQVAQLLEAIGLQLIRHVTPRGQTNQTSEIDYHGEVQPGESTREYRYQQWEQIFDADIAAVEKSIIDNGLVTG